MGTFVVHVRAVGGHGCQREIKGGNEVLGCESENCPDCAARRFVADLKRMGCSFGDGGHAQLIHWPGEASSVYDDLLTGKRAGSF